MRMASEIQITGNRVEGAQEKLLVRIENQGSLQIQHVETDHGSGGGNVSRKR